MGIETIHLERFVCDRCTTTEDIPTGKVELRERWGWATAQGYQGAQIFSQDYRITLCPECRASLRTWSQT